MIAPITTIAAIVLAAWFVVLTVRIFGARRDSGVSLGTGDDKTLMRRVRGQGNFVETVPIALIVMAAAELQPVGLYPAAFTIALAGAAIALVTGRLMHGYAFSFSDHSPIGRMGGMTLTLLSMIALIVLAIFALLF